MFHTKGGAYSIKYREMKIATLGVVTWRSDDFNRSTRTDD